MHAYYYRVLRLELVAHQYTTGSVDLNLDSRVVAHPHPQVILRRDQGTMRAYYVELYSTLPGMRRRSHRTWTGPGEEVSRRVPIQVSQSTQGCRRSGGPVAKSVAA